METPQRKEKCNLTDSSFYQIVNALDIISDLGDNKVRMFQSTKELHKFNSKVFPCIILSLNSKMKYRL